MTQNLFFPQLIFDSVFDDFIRTTTASQRVPTGFPVFDQYSDEDGNAVLEFALAGYKAEDLSVAVEGSKLTVSSEGAQSDGEKSPATRRIAKRKFVNTFTDHENTFDLQGLTASFEDGILRIEVPKKEEAKAKTFEIVTKKALPASA
jgi:HSP20 family protein